MSVAAVGSTNPTKIGAARRAFQTLFPDVVVTGVDVASGVSEQPVGEDETMQGALNRARAAREARNADWGVGIEGGVLFRGDECWQIQYCAVVHRDGRTGLCGGLQFLLPPVVAEGIRAGGEVGPLFDQISGQQDTKRKGGAIGYLTNGAVLREDIYTYMVAGALVRYLHPHLYDQETR